MRSLTKALDQLDIRLGSSPFKSPSAKKSTAFEENDLIRMIGGKKVGSRGYFVRYSGKGVRRRAIIHLEKFGKCTSSLTYIEKQIWKTDTWKKNEIPDVESHGVELKQRFDQNMLVIPSNDGTNDQRLVLLGGYNMEGDGLIIRQSKSVQCLQFRGGQSNPRWSSLPDMQKYRRNFLGAACVKEKVYAIGGFLNNNIRRAAYEVLDLNDIQRGWVEREIPVTGFFFFSCRAVAVGNRHIYAICDQRDESKMNSGLPLTSLSLISYDTQADTWNTKLPKPLINQAENKHCSCYSVTSIVIPGEGTYIVVVVIVIGDIVIPKKIAQAYHVESNNWIRLPYLPYEFHVETGGSLTRCPVLTAIGNRYILVAGSQSVVVLDWKQRKWIALPSKPEVRNAAAGAFVGGSVNKLIISGGWNGIRAGPSSLSLDIAPGIGWAKEKLLLLCFKKKAQKCNKKVKVKGPCLLEDLDSGIFANILTYLFVPFQKEIKCKGSIFGDMLSVGKRSCDPSTTSQATKKSRIAL